MSMARNSPLLLFLIPVFTFCKSCITDLSVGGMISHNLTLQNPKRKVCTFSEHELRDGALYTETCSTRSQLFCFFACSASVKNTYTQFALHDMTFTNLSLLMKIFLLYSEE